MTNSMTDLNRHLFAQIERLGDKKLSQDEVANEVSRTKAIVSISEQIIDNAKITLGAAELVANHGCGQWENMLPAIDGKPESPSAKIANQISNTAPQITKPKTTPVPNYKTGEISYD